MQDLNHVRAFLNSVVDQDRCVDKLANARFASHRTADIREALQKLDVIEKGVAELFSGRRKVSPGIFEDVLEIG